MKIAIVALLGLVSVEAYRLRGSRDRSFVGLEEMKFEEKLPDFHGYTPEYSGFIGNNHEGGEWRDAYER